MASKTDLICHVWLPFDKSVNSSDAHTCHFLIGLTFHRHHMLVQVQKSLYENIWRLLDFLTDAQ